MRKAMLGELQLSSTLCCALSCMCCCCLFGRLCSFLAGACSGNACDQLLLQFKESLTGSRLPCLTCCCLFKGCKLLTVLLVQFALQLSNLLLLSSHLHKTLDPMVRLQFSLFSLDLCGCERVGIGRHLQQSADDFDHSTEANNITRTRRASSPFKPEADFRSLMQSFTQRGAALRFDSRCHPVLGIRPDVLNSVHSVTKIIMLACMSSQQYLGALCCSRVGSAIPKQLSQQKQNRWISSSQDRICIGTCVTVTVENSTYYISSAAAKCAAFYTAASKSAIL